MVYRYSFEKLEVWQLSRKLVKVIYELTSKFPSDEKFNLTSQVRRASVSIVSNIAEGSSRTSLKDQIRFLEIAYGSLMELYTQLYIALDLAYITELEMDSISLLVKEISNKLNALSNTYRKHAESK